MRTFSFAFFITLFIPTTPCYALLSLNGPKKMQQQKLKLDPTFINPNVINAGITEELCIDTAARMQRVLVPVSETIHPNEEVGISYSYWPAERTRGSKNKLPAVVLIHGFDSSNLEFRRLGSRLSQRGIDTYAVDLLGWGYTQLQQDVQTFSASAKVEALNSFVETVVGTNFCIAGASLGGAASMEVSVMNENCAGLILIDAQGFVDGIGPMASLPKPLAKVGVEILKSTPLRSSANQMSYYDKKSYATDEAVVVGRLHCLQEGWSDALVSFMQSGGFSPSKLVPQVNVPTLILWGRQDTILDGREFTTKFVDALNTKTTLRWIENCGHVPHLEQPDETADAIVEFVSSLDGDKPRAGTGSTGDNANSTINTELTATVINVVGFAGVSAIAASFAADWLPTF